MGNIKKMIKFLQAKTGFGIIRLHVYYSLIQYISYISSDRLMKILDFSLADCPQSDVWSIISKIKTLSKSQLLQDIFVLIHLDFKRDGYFVEFGATNGVELSNTWLLEKEFSWKSILAEPSKNWHADLSKTRSFNTEKKAVWIKSNEKLRLLEVNAPEYTTISDYRNTDSHPRKGHTYEVETKGLLDLLIKYDASKEIDYLIIDTEVS